MSKKLSYLLFLFSTPVFAQSVECPVVEPTYHVTVNDLPITYYNHLSSKQLPLATKSHGGRKSDLLGVFEPKIKIATNARAKGLKNKTSSCLYLSEIHLDLEFKPTIYIATEAQQFTCTHQRTLNHEHTHYNNNHEAFKLMVQNIEPILQKYYGNIPVSYNNQLNLNQVVDSQNESIANEMQAIIDEQATPYDNQLDTIENYTQESKLCSNHENQALNRLLKR